MSIFKKKKYVTYEIEKSNGKNEPQIPSGFWIKCDSCSKIIYKKDMEKYKVCTECGHYFSMSALDRLNLICDEGTFEEMFIINKIADPLNFPDYKLKIEALKNDLKIDDAIVIGECKINDIKCIVGVMDNRFMMGSMGSVVGEKITLAFEYATKNKLPVILFTASGGARMQEGIISLMQMAKISSAVANHNNEGLLYISYLTNPTSGGVTASFAMLGDIILAEPNALVCFAGPRVISQTINHTLPEGFQKSEFVMEHGFIDKIVKRQESKYLLNKILKMHIKK